VCADISIFTSYHARGFFFMIRNGLHATILLLVDLKFTLGKIVQLKNNMQHVPSIKKNLVSVSPIK
jgi:hypothetical protein